MSIISIVPRSVYAYGVSVSKLFTGKYLQHKINSQNRQHFHRTPLNVQKLHVHIEFQVVNPCFIKNEMYDAEF